MTRGQPMISIVIPCKRINDYIKESVSYILNLNYNNFEILIFPDTASNENFEKTRIIPTGKIGPAQKRNLALKYAKGEILAFLDDDAYPKKDWLLNAVEHFKNPKIAAVGGPAVTPKQDGFWQKVSGAVFLSKLSGGNPERYWPVGKVREIKDWPSVNLLVRKSDFMTIDGFNCKFWPGEDTKLCLDLIKKLRKKIIYDPQVLVYHHRRSGLLRHLKQIGSYGIHRGFFAKKYPENSFELKYFLPSAFLIFVIAGWVLLFLPLFFKLVYLCFWLLYGLALLFSVLGIYNKIRNFKIAFATIPYTFLTHIYYGWRFIRGFVFTKKLKSKLR